MDLVMMRGRDAVCDSLEVAEHFGKRHDNVIMTIDNLLKIKEIKAGKYSSHKLIRIRREGHTEITL